MTRWRPLRFRAFSLSLLLLYLFFSLTLIGSFSLQIPFRPRLRHPRDASNPSPSSTAAPFDLLIYAATPGGIATAISASRFASTLSPLLPFSPCPSPSSSPRSTWVA